MSTYTWIGGRGDFDNPAMWIGPFALPGPSDTAEFTSDGIVDGTGSTYDLQIDGANVSIDGTITLSGLFDNQSLTIFGGGTVAAEPADLATVAGVSIGSTPGTNATLTVTGSNSSLISGDILVGLGSNSAYLYVLAGGALSAAANGSATALAVGAVSGSTGTLVADGLGSSVTVGAGGLWIGYQAAGEVSVQNKAYLDVTDTNTGVFVGNYGTGILIVDGAGSVLEDAGALGIGGFANGTVYVRNGGSLDVPSGIVLGPEPNYASGQLVVTVGGILTSGQIAVANGSVSVSSDGTITSSGDIQIGAAALNSGTVSVDGASITSQEIDVGYAGDGTLTLSDSGSATTGVLIAGVSLDSTGTVIAGDGSTLTVSSEMVVGDSGQGEVDLTGGVLNAGALAVGYTAAGQLNLTSGATVSTTSDLFIGVYSGGSGTLSASGSGTSITTTGDLRVGYATAGTVTVTGGASLSINSLLLGESAGGAGLVSFGADANVSIAGDIDIGGGSTVQINGDSLAPFGINIATGGTLSGFGTVAPESGLTTNDGTIVASSAGHTLTVSGEIAGTGTMIVQPGSTELSLHGTVVAGQTIIFSGSGGSGFVGGILSIGDLNDFAGTIEGFQRGETIDVADLVANTITYNPMISRFVLEEQTSGQTAMVVGTLDLAGISQTAPLTARTDGDGGTDITVGGLWPTDPLMVTLESGDDWSPPDDNDNSTYTGTVNIGLDGRKAVLQVAGATVARDQYEFVFSAGATAHLLISGVSAPILQGPFDLIYAEASATKVNSGGDEYVLSGGTAIGMTSNSGSETMQFGSASGITVNAGGTEYVYSGGAVIGTTVKSGGIEHVSTGGTATSTTVTGGYEIVSSGGTTSSATVISGGYEVVSSGGTASGATVSSGGFVVVSSAGTANGTIVDGGGTETVSYGGKTSKTTVNSGGTEVVLAGGVATSAAVNSSGTQVVSFHGTTSKSVVSAGGTEIVYLGGTAASITVSSGGTEVVSYGGAASNTTVSSGGTEVVSVGGAASKTSVTTSGTEIVTFRGIAVSATVNSGGTEIALFAGTTNKTTLKGGGAEYVRSGSTASKTTVSVGSFEYISIGGVATGTTLKLGNDDVFRSGTAIGTKVSAGGDETVFPGGRSISATIYNGGYQIVSSGGTTISTTVSSGAHEVVSSGGTASFTVVASGGDEVLSSDGSATSTTVKGGGTIDVAYLSYFSSGSASVNPTTDLLTVSVGSKTYTQKLAGTYTSTAFLLARDANGGTLVEANSTSSGTVVSSSGVEVVYSGGTASGATVSNGGYELVSSGGTAISTTVDGGGYEVISSQGSAVSTTVNTGGYELVSSGGWAAGTTVNSGGYEVVSFGGSAVNTIVNSGGYVTVSSGGTAVSTTINSGGFEAVSAGGSALSTTVNSGVAEFVFSGGSAVGTTVNSGGVLVVLPGGSQSATMGAIVSTGVLLYQPNSGFTSFTDTANDTSVGSGATEYILPDGSAISTTVTSGGTDYIYSGGTAISTTVSSGGYQYVSSGGTADFTVVSNGGIEVVSGGTASFTALEIGGTIDLAYYTYSGDATVSVTSTSLLTVSVGSQTYTQQLSGDYGHETFMVRPDTGSGMLITAAAPCFRRGTRILTDRGEVAVEELRVGDLVQKVVGEATAPIIWIGQRQVDCAHHPKPMQVWPVLVAAGAFGPGRPHSDLFLSPDHAIYIEGVLIPIKHLINGSSIVQVPVDRVTYHHIELEQHDVLLAEGLPAESFLDMKDGSNYANRPGPARLYPDFSARMWEAFGYAPLVVTGPELDAARALVGSFAAAVVESGAMGRDAA